MPSGSMTISSAWLAARYAAWSYHAEYATTDLPVARN